MKAKVIAFVLLGLGAWHVTLAEPATEKSIRELMALTGGGARGVEMIQTLLPMMKQALPEAPEAFWTEFMANVHPDDLVALIVPIYQRNVSEDDVQAALAFYRSPAGSHILGKMPLIMQESQKAGRQWGVDLMVSASAKLKSEQADKAGNAEKADQADKAGNSDKPGGAEKSGPPPQPK